MKKSTDFAAGTAASAASSAGDSFYREFEQQQQGGHGHGGHGGSIHANLSESDNTWLWWLIMAFGLFICVKAILQYLRIKRTWMSLSNAARERLFFFY